MDKQIYNYLLAFFGGMACYTLASAIAWEMPYNEAKALAMSGMNIFWMMFMLFFIIVIIVFLIKCLKDKQEVKNEKARYDRRINQK